MPLPSRVPLPGGEVLLLEEVRPEGEQPGIRCRLEGAPAWGPTHSDIRAAAAAASGLSLEEAWRAISDEFIAHARRQAATTGGEVCVSWTQLRPLPPRSETSA